MKLTFRSRRLFLLFLALLMIGGVSPNCGATQPSGEAKPKRSFLTADSSKKRLAIVGEDGELQWEHKIGPLHDLHMLPGGNILFQLN